MIVYGSPGATASQRRSSSARSPPRARSRRPSIERSIAVLSPASRGRSARRARGRAGRSDLLDLRRLAGVLADHDPRVGVAERPIRTPRGSSSGRSARPRRRRARSRGSRTSTPAGCSRAAPPGRRARPRDRPARARSRRRSRRPRRTSAHASLRRAGSGPRAGPGGVPPRSPRLARSSCCWRLPPLSPSINLLRVVASRVMIGRGRAAAPRSRTRASRGRAR